MNIEHSNNLTLLQSRNIRLPVRTLVHQPKDRIPSTTVWQYQDVYYITSDVSQY